MKSRAAAAPGFSLVVGAVAVGVSLATIVMAAGCTGEKVVQRIVVVTPTESRSGTPTPVATDPQPTASPTVSDFGAFAAGWSRHGFGMSVAENGEGTASWRVYKWCHDDPTPPCDSITESEIVSGGRATLVFASVDGATAYGWVKESTDEGRFVEGSPVSLTLLSYGLAVLEHTWYSMERMAGGSGSMVLCGPDMDMPDWLQERSPCGA